MSYPFLPVNPCCTDVVLNSPCGCTSTLPNTGCGEDQCGTNVILSSNVLYNGPVLDCIIAEPCDTLNVILQKIDEIICNLLSQINILNIQVANITTQIINIEGDIININNTLDECCGATTTTTTTTEIPSSKLILSQGNFADLGTACSSPFIPGINVYTINPTINIGDVIFEDDTFLLPFDGSGKPWTIQLVNLTYIGVIIDIDGKVLDILVC